MDATDSGKPKKEEAEAEDLAVDHKAPADHLFAIILLVRKQGYVHEVLLGNVNNVEKTDALLPDPTQKLGTYAIIYLSGLSIVFADRRRTIAGQESMIIPDGLLQCSKVASPKEVIGMVTMMVEDVAEECGLTLAVEVSKPRPACPGRRMRHEVWAPRCGQEDL